MAIRAGMMPGTAATRFALAISPGAFTLGSRMTALGAKRPLAGSLPMSALGGLAPLSRWFLKASRRCRKYRGSLRRGCCWVLSVGLPPRRRGDDAARSQPASIHLRPTASTRRQRESIERDFQVTAPITFRTRQTTCRDIHLQRQQHLTG